MGRRMSEADWEYIDGLDVLDDTAAHMLAEEFAWGWSSCWFASTGQFDHEAQANSSYFTPAGLMDRALFAWWMDGDDITDPQAKEPRTLKARALMCAYLYARQERSEMGPIDGFNRMWSTEPTC